MVKTLQKKPICDYNFDDEMLIKGKQQLSLKIFIYPKIHTKIYSVDSLDLSQDSNKLLFLVGPIQGSK